MIGSDGHNFGVNRNQDLLSTARFANNRVGLICAHRRHGGEWDVANRLRVAQERRAQGEECQAESVHVSPNRLTSAPNSKAFGSG